MSTSTLNSRDIAARVRARLGFILPQPLIARADHNTDLLIPGGCERLEKSIRSTDDRHWLVKSVEKAPTDGVLDLTHADFAGMYIAGFRAEGAITAPGLVFSHVPSFDALLAEFPNDDTCVWFHLRDKTLTFRNPEDGEINTFADLLNLTSTCIPELGNDQRPMVHELDDQLIDRIAEMVKELGGLQFLSMDPQQARGLVSK